jgi:lipid A 3-O-deacylase
MFPQNIRLKSLFALAAVLATQSGFAADNQLIDSVSVAYGAGSKVHMARIGIQSDWNARWFQSDGRHLGGYWDASFASWRGTEYQNIPGAKIGLTDVGLTPVFRFQHDNKKGLYFEAGIGLHRLSKIYYNGGDRLSTHFQFGDHIGIGYVFDNKWEATAKFQHFSNGGYKKPNSGVNFVEIQAAYHF